MADQIDQQVEYPRLERQLALGEPQDAAGSSSRNAPNSNVTRTNLQ